MAAEPTSEPMPEPSLERRLNLLLADHPGVLISAAESLTGGEVGRRITAIAGSSDYFLGSIVAYSNGAKHALLGVSKDILETRGAVSDECARAMADGSRAAFGSHAAVSTTGIAGPGGATPRKPVGLVYIAVAGDVGVVSEEHHFSGDRAAITAAAAEQALKHLLHYLERMLASAS
jgi:PncC family amidohydrolase